MDSLMLLHDANMARKHAVEDAGKVGSTEREVTLECASRITLNGRNSPRNCGR